MEKWLLERNERSVEVESVPGPSQLYKTNKEKTQNDIENKEGHNELCCKACRSSIHKMTRMLFTIEQLLLNVNPNIQNNSINLNLPIATPERLQEFNKLITEDFIASLQYVDRRVQLAEKEYEVRGNIVEERNDEYTGTIEQRILLDKKSQEINTKNLKVNVIVNQLIDIKEQEFDKFMLDYKKSLVCSNERKKKVDKELESGAIKKMGKKTAKQSTFKKDLALRKKNQEENDEMETKVCLSEGRKTKEEISKYAAKETIIESNAIKNNGNDSDNYIIIDKDKIIRNVNRLVKIQGRLVLEGKGTEKKSLEQIEKVNRFASSHRGDIIIIAKLNPRKCSTKGGRNFLRIIDKVMETKVRPIKVVKSGFNAVDLYYDNILNANKCLDFYKGIPRDEQDIWFDIMERIVYEWKDTRNIVVTFEGNELPEQLSLYEGLTYIWKEYNVCVVCGKESHGNCENEYNCVNRSGKHKANFKRCPIYKFNKNVQYISAKNCISIYEAKKIIAGRNKAYQNPWIQPENWPNLPKANQKNNTSVINRNVIKYNRKGEFTENKQKQFNNYEEEITKDKSGIAVIEEGKGRNIQRRSNISQLIEYLDNLHDQEWSAKEIEENLITKMDLSSQRNVTNLYLINSDTLTRIGEGGRNPSNLDRMFCTKDLVHRMSYKQKSDTWGSDHHPIVYIIDEELKTYKRITNRITTKRTDWKMFEVLMEKNLEMFSSKEYNLKNHIEKYNLLKDVIIKAVEEASGRNNNIEKPQQVRKNKSKNPVEWWDEDCKEIIKARKEKLRKFKKSKELQDYIEFKKARAMATKTTQTAQNILRIILNMSRTVQDIYDIAIYVQDKKRIKRKEAIKEAIRSLGTNLKYLGLELQPTKPIIVDFNKESHIPKNIEVNILDNPVYLQKEAKFLGIWLDNKLKFEKQCQYIKEKAVKVNGLLRYCNGITKGMEVNTAVMLYKSLNANNSLKVERAQFLGLRTALGFRNSTPNNVLLGEAKVMSIKDRATYLARNFMIKTMAYGDEDLKGNIEKLNKEELLQSITGSLPKIYILIYTLERDIIMDKETVPLEPAISSDSRELGSSTLKRQIQKCQEEDSSVLKKLNVSKNIPDTVLNNRYTKSCQGPFEIVITSTGTANTSIQPLTVGRLLSSTLKKDIIEIKD
ncbi:uncharacterized protein [Polyergus mexicanus]|uniref:uncharacterized protein n=1 Tax=Polyergus mexicanus TaxID=615972 RepID=UPI0038B49D35